MSLMNWLTVMIVICGMAVSAAAGNFTISNSVVLTDMTALDEANPQKNYGNSSANSIGKAGPSSTRWHHLIRFNSLRDTMIALGDKQWDSARIGIVIGATPTAGDSIFVSAFKIIRDWEEGVGGGVDTCGACWDSANQVGHGSCVGAAVDWGTNGCMNTTTDRSGIRETCSGRADSLLLVSGGSADVGDTVYFYISGATVADTMGAGIALIPVAYGGDDGVQSLSGFRTDDASGYRPWLTVWYSEKTTVSAALLRRRLIIRRQKLN